jgi:hypothetical protein
MGENKEIQLLPCPFCGGEGAMRVNAQTGISVGIQTWCTLIGVWI